jgi:flagellar basal-body rod protein FlgC
MTLSTTLQVSASALNAQSTRLRIIAENLANSDSTAQSPGGEPYRRKVVTFKTVLDRSIGASTVKVASVKGAGGDFERRYDPGHPAADAEGYILMPNINPLVEVMDMREAQRSYQANLAVIEAAKSMIGRTLDLLHG